MNAWAQNDLEQLAGNLGQTNELLTSLNVDGADFSLANIIAWLIFGLIGMAGFIYGKKQKEFKPMAIGIGLMVYPYFVNQTLWLYIVGIGLSALLWFWRD